MYFAHLSFKILKIGKNKMKKSITILLSAANSPTMPGLISCFRADKEHEIRIIGMDMCSDDSVHFIVNKFYQVPIATDSTYCDKVLEICKKEKVDIYFPNISAEVASVCKRLDDFDKVGVKVSASRLDVGKINDKLSVYKFLKNSGIAIPAFYEVKSVEDFEKGCQLLGYPQKPVCLKIVDGSGSRGVRIIDSKKSRYKIFINEKPNSFYISYDEMLSILKEADQWHDMMLLEYMPGNEYTVDALADNGKTLYMVGRENTVSLMSIAQQSTVAYDEKAYNIAEKVISLYNMDGNVGFDFMRAADGSPMLMDINPRITATVSVIAAAGVNLPLLRVKQLLGEQLPQNVSIAYGTSIKRRYGEIYTDPNGKRIIIG